MDPEIIDKVPNVKIGDKIKLIRADRTQHGN